MNKPLLCLIGMLLVFSQTYRATAHQKPPQDGITIEFSNLSLYDVLDLVQTRFGINFVYNERILAGMRNISGTFNNVSLKDFLNNVLQQKLGELEYQIIDNSVVIRKRAVKKTPLRISGTVVNMSSGDPMPGVTIIFEGSNQGTTTDKLGNYELLVPERSVRLRVSFLGFETVNIDLDRYLTRYGHYEVQRDRWSLDAISLKEIDFDIEEVVITGIVNRTASSFTGSTHKMTYQDIRSTGATNVMQSLKILDPSLRIFENMQMGSDPNTIPDFELRGSSSLGLGSGSQSELRGKYEYRPNQPLFILDGFETYAETIFNMDVNRIGSITVLKDASAKALYGSKASNGVIIVESRTMAETGTVVSINYDLSIEAPDLRSYNLANAAEKLALEHESEIYTGVEQIIPSQYQIYLDRKRLVDNGLNTYWLSKPVRTGIRHNLSAMVEFGDSHLRNSLAFSANMNDGVMKGSSRNTSAADIRTLYKKGSVSFRNSAHMGYTKSTDSHYGSFSQYTKLQPYTPAYNADGSVNRFIMDIMNMALLQGSNPFYDATLPQILKNNAVSIFENVELEWRTPVPNLRTSVQAGIAHDRYDDDRFYSAEHSRFVGVDPARKGSYDYSTGEMTAISGAATATYSLSAKKHSLFFSGRFDMQSQTSSEELFQTEGYTSINLTSISHASSYKKDARPVGSKVTKRQLSGLVIINYVFDNRYSIDFNLRRDGSSVFSDKNKWTTSTSSGVMWNIHNEKFMAQSNLFDKLALRASVGTTGNQNQGNNYSVYSYSSENWYMGLPGATVNGMENTNLKWEKKQDYNVGLDVSLKDLDLTVEYYDSYTSNMVTAITIAPSIGFRTYPENLGQIRNNGVDLRLSYNIWQNKDGFVRLRLAMITNQNKLRKLSDTMREFNRKQDELAAGEAHTTPVKRYVDGQDMNTLWAVRSLGIDPASGRELFLNRDGRLTFIWDARDMVGSGSSNIGCNGTAGISAAWKNVRFDMSVGLWTNAKTYNQTIVDMVEDANMQESNVDRRAIYNRWKQQGDEARFDQYLQGPMTKPSTRFIQDYTRIKLQNIQLTYEFGKRQTRMLGMERLNVTVSADNLWEWWSTGFERGTDYPFSRNFRMAVSATF